MKMIARLAGLFLFFRLLGLCRGFDGDFLTDERAVLVEFYSGMCGSCKEFAPTWTKIEKAAKSIATAKVNIDEDEGMTLAESLGVLDEGLPNIRLFNSLSNKNGVSILPGMPEPYKVVFGRIKGNLSGMSKRDDGLLLKRA